MISPHIYFIYITVFTIMYYILNFSCNTDQVTFLMAHRQRKNLIILHSTDNQLLKKAKKTHIPALEMIHNHSQMFPRHIFRAGILFMAWSVIFVCLWRRPNYRSQVIHHFTLYNQLLVGFQAPVISFGLAENSSQE